MDKDKSTLSALVVRLQKGDGKAFEEIYNITRESAYFTALKISKNEEDAEDILQESYVHMIDKINTLENPDVFQSWFNQIVANKSRDLLRKNHPERYTEAYFENEEGEEVSKFDFIEDNDEVFIPEASVENTELCTEVMKMIDSLSDDKRTAVVLFYYDNMTTKEIAESLGVNENTIKSRLVQAKKDIAKSVAEYEKKHGKLLGVAPMPVVVWALKASAAGAASASAASGAAATTLAAVTAGTAVAGTAAGAAAGAAAGTGIAAKIIAGVVAAAIVGGGAIAGTKAVENYRQKNAAEETSVSDFTQESSINDESESEEDKNTDDDRLYLLVDKEDKKVDTEVHTVKLKYGVTGAVQTYVINGSEKKEDRPSINRTEFHATYNELLPAAKENRQKYSSYINEVLRDINSERTNADDLELDESLTLQANARAEEIAWSGSNSSVRPDGSSFTTVFDTNGYTDGTRYEIRAAGYSSPSEASKIWRKSSNRSMIENGNISKAGIGVAEDPETGKLVFVIHLYSPAGSESNDKQSVSDEVIDKLNESSQDAQGELIEAIERNEEIFDRLYQIPVIGDILKIDIPIDELYLMGDEISQDIRERIIKTVDTIFNGR